MARIFFERLFNYQMRSVILICHERSFEGSRIGKEHCIRCADCALGFPTLVPYLMRS